jgi:3-methylfumaryl-CoA hydratase
MTDAQASTRIDAQLLAQLRGWEGRSETLRDPITAAPVRGLSATLDRPDPAPVTGDELPPLWHWLYFLPQAPQHELGEDGHPHRGGFLPPVPLPRRMWAGGRLQWLEPLRVGDEVQKTSKILSVAHKAGRSGDLVFTTVRHELAGGAGLALREEQDIVYRAMAQPGDPAPAPQAAPTDATWSREIVPDPVLLFRYSALTFNGHRIHYDRSYAIEREAYPALVVHGPLIATLLADLARRALPQGRFASFSFRAVRPLFDLHPFRVCGKPSADSKSAQLWAQDHEGWLAMQAEVKFQ